MNKLLIVLFVIVALFFGCSPQQKSVKAGSKGKPEWLLNPQKIYPDSKYLVAIGEADTHQESQNIAASNLSKIFEMEVKADESTLQRASEIISSKGSSTEESMEVTKNVNIFSSQKLLNVKFGESYTNAIGRVYSIAVLNRFETASIYEDKINENSSAIIQFSQKAQESENLLHRYSFLNAASLVAQTNEILLAQLSIISIHDKEMIDLPYNQDKINQQLALTAKSISFQIVIHNDEDNKIEKKIQETLTDMGFVSGKSALLQISGNLDFENTDLKRDDGFVFVRYNFQIELKTENNVVATYTNQGREGHLNRTEAKARIYTKLSKNLKKQFKRKIENYFDSLTK